MNAPDPLLKIAKIVRALQHLQGLSTEVSAFFESADHEVVADFKAEAGYLVVKALSRSQPYSAWSLPIGEILYQFRSALDHLACKLTEDNGGAVDKYVEFPIFLKADNFRRNGVLTPAIQARIGGMSPSHQTAIEEEQPFQGKYGVPEDDPLWVLYGLSNFDRHRDLHLASTTIREGREEFDPSWFAERYFTQIVANYGKPFEGETEVARYRINPAAHEVVPQVAVQVKANVAFSIAFDEKGPGAGRPVINTLGGIGDRVARLVGRFYS